MAVGDHTAFQQKTEPDCAVAVAVDHAPPTTADCTTHLHLLELFVELRENVELLATKGGADADETWRLFVKAAVVRFAKWFQAASRSALDMEAISPPLDVLMAWHAFMLNPHSYKTFCGLTRTDVTGLRGISWSGVASSLCSGNALCILF